MTLAMKYIHALKRTGFGVLCDSEPVVWLDHTRIRSDVPLPLHVHVAIFATGFVDDVLRSMVPLLQLAVFRFLCNVR